MNLRGVFPPIPTPFEHDTVNPTALRRNVERWMTTGLRGLVVLGTNGEAALLDDDESDGVIETARDGVPADRLLIAGTARESTRATIAATRRAAALGADAVLVRTPSFFKSQMTGGVLFDHYRAVADAATVPVLLYNFTRVTGVTLQPAVVARLAAHPNIVGIKESGSDLAHVAALIDETPEDFSVLAGAAPTFYPSLSLGAIGGVLALAAVVPDACVKLYELSVGARHAEARELQRRLTPLARAVTVTYGIAGLKAALEIAGYVGGPARAPLPPVPPAAIEEIRQHWSALTVTNHA